MEIKERILRILEAMKAMDNVQEYYKNHDDLTVLDFNSLTFIEFVVKLEEEFDIEFDDESLDYSMFTSLFVLCKYIESLMDGQEYEFKADGIEEETANNQEIDDERTERVREDILTILGHRCNVEQLNKDVWKMQLADLELSMEQGQEIFLEIQKTFDVELDQKIILAYNLFTLEKICFYIVSQI